MCFWFLKSSSVIGWTKISFVLLMLEEFVCAWMDKDFICASESWRACSCVDVQIVRMCVDVQRFRMCFWCLKSLSLCEWTKISYVWKNKNFACVWRALSFAFDLMVWVYVCFDRKTAVRVSLSCLGGRRQRVWGVIVPLFRQAGGDKLAWVADNVVSLKVARVWVLALGMWIAAMDVFVAAFYVISSEAVFVACVVINCKMLSNVLNLKKYCFLLFLTFNFLIFIIYWKLIKIFWYLINVFILFSFSSFSKQFINWLSYTPLLTYFLFVYISILRL